MREGITLAGSSNAARSPTREACGASGTTLSNNEASNVDYLNEIKKDFISDQRYPPDTGLRESSGLVYTRSSFSGGSSSCGYNGFKSNSQEVASQKSKDTDPRIRSSSSSQSNPESDSQTSRISQNCIDFKEVAILFDKVDDNKDKLLVITDVVYTLQRDHSVGWVHRDISTRNVYLCTDAVTQEKKGMIGYFEYAKMAGVGSQNEVRTGTPDFMSVEISRQRYLFAKLSKDTAEGKGLDDYMQRLMHKEENPEQVGEPKGIYYNYIHDLESVWWIAVWALFNFEKKDAGTNKSDSQATRQRKFNKDTLFSGTVGNQDRFEFLSVRTTYADTTGCLPKYFENLIRRLGTIAEAIIEFYQWKELDYQVNESNKEEPILWDESSTIHGIFIGLLSNVMEEFEIVRVTGIDDKILPATQSNKRRTDEQDSERSNKRQRSTLETASR